jgi:hypothetical protein
MWEESRENVELEEIIGHGNFGEVYRGKLIHINPEFSLRFYFIIIKVNGVKNM